MAKIKIKTAAEIEKIEKACSIVKEVLARLGEELRPGLTTEDLDRLGEKLIRELGAVPVFIGYRGYKHATCISVNEQVVHGVPGPRQINDGDIVSVDIGAKIDGYCGDISRTFAVGKIPKKIEKLLRAGQTALAAGIKQCRAGNHLGDIGAAIEREAKKNGFAAVRDLFGHGIGTDLHEDPLIPNYGIPGEGPELKSGMVLCIEPMLNTWTEKIKTLADGWTVVTADSGWSCHFEHTVLILESGPRILTA